jgi:hypothetical protein
MGDAAHHGWTAGRRGLEMDWMIVALAIVASQLLLGCAVGWMLRRSRRAALPDRGARSEPPALNRSAYRRSS